MTGAGSELDSESPQGWTTPGAFEVVAGIHRIPLPLPQDGFAR